MEIGDIAHIASEPNRHWKGVVMGKRKQHGGTVLDIEGVEHKDYKATAKSSCFILIHGEFWMYNIDNYCAVCESEGKTSIQVLGHGVCADCTRRIVRNYLSDNL